MGLDLEKRENLRRMKHKSIKLWKVDNQGNELEVIEYKILKMLKSTEDTEMMIYENT